MERKLMKIGVIAFLLLSGEPPFGGCGGPEPMMEVRANILVEIIDLSLQRFDAAYVMQ